MQEAPRSQCASQEEKYHEELISRQGRFSDEKLDNDAVIAEYAQMYKDEFGFACRQERVFERESYEEHCELVNGNAATEFAVIKSQAEESVIKVRAKGEEQIAQMRAMRLRDEDMIHTLMRGMHEEVLCRVNETHNNTTC